MSKKYTADILDSTIENGYGRINLGQWGVGIGSATNPRAGIETDSDAILKNGVWINNNSSVYFADTVNNYGTSYAYIWGNGNAGTSFLAFDTNAGRAMTIDNSRNVGIGTTLPRAALDITGLGMMFGYSSTNAAERDWLISTNYASYGDFVIRQSNAKDGNPYSDGTTRLAIDSSGNVGIGVTPFTNSLTSGLDLKNGGGLFGFANALFLTGNVYYNGAFKAKATAGSSHIKVGDQIEFYVNPSTSADSSVTLTERMRIDSSGVVQVRNQTPTIQLYNTDTSLEADQLIGTLDFYRSDASGEGAGVSSSIQVHSENSIGSISYMSFHTDGGTGDQNAERMRIDSDGNVGINVVPVERFVVKGGNFLLQSSNTGGVDTSNNIIIKDLDTTASSGQGIGSIQFYGSDVSGAGAGIKSEVKSFYASDGNSSILTFSTSDSVTNNQERMRIDSSGNVGIGTTNLTSIATGYTGLTINGSGGGLNRGGFISLKQVDTEIGRIIVAQDEMGVFTTGAYPIAFSTNSTERMRIDSSGSLLMNNTTSVIGVNSTDGTDNKRLILSGASSGSTSRGAYILLAGEEYAGINGNASIVTGSSGFFSVNTGGSEKMRIDSSGNVGINTQTQAGTNGLGLAIYASDYPRLTFRNSTTGDTTGDGTQFAGVGNNFQIVNKEAGDLLFSTNNTERMRIDSSGNLSLATATSLDFNVSDFAQIKFKESGAITIDSDNNQSSRNFQFKDGDGSSLMFIGDNGNVGIGTASPASKLHVVGDGTDAGGIRLTQSGTQTHYIYTQSQYQINRIGSSAATWRWGQQGGSDFMALNSTGLGIGTTSPSVPLEVNVGLNSLKISGRDTYIDSTIDSANANIYVTQAGVGDFSQEAGHLVLQARTQGTVYRDIIFAGGLANGEALMTINGQGNVGIGTSPSRTFHVHTPTATDIHLTTTASGTSSTDGATISLSGTQMIINQRENDVMRFQTNTTERMRITSGGDILFGTQGQPDGTTYFGSGFHPSSYDRDILQMATNGTGALNLIEFFNPNGNVGKIQTSGSATVYATSSDYRLKEDWQPMSGALDRVDALKPVNFAWKADGTRVDGFLAHELQEVIPEAVTGEKDAVDEEGNPVYQGIDQSKVVPLLVGAIQELKKEIELLKSQING
jgi:hypothetical protein